MCVFFYYYVPICSTLLTGHCSIEVNQGMIFNMTSLSPSIVNSFFLCPYGANRKCYLVLLRQIKVRPGAAGAGGQYCVGTFMWVRVCVIVCVC